ncbi:MAG TPA: group 1 truncated hemoglobin [Humisphaera sp.]|nr:group 1 truncated hemoglobin [Humisphaera sp.]
MSEKFKVKITCAAALVAAMLAAGCGGAIGQKKDKDFFTSGSHEADQRADQRMAKSEQLAGGTTGTKTSDASAGKAAQANDTKALYDRLGGGEGLVLIVDDFTPRILADPRVNFAREGVTRGGFSFHHWSSVTWNASPENIQQLKKHMVQFIALATGGPSVYDGKEMQSAHAGMHISNPEFDAAVGDLKATLDKLKIANKEQKELLSVIESTRPQIAEER